LALSAGLANGLLTAGPLTLARPKLHGTSERFASQLFGTCVLRTNALEALVIAGFVRGLPVRDVEAALVEALGDEAAVSKSTVSRVCEQIKARRWPPSARADQETNDRDQDASDCLARPARERRR
jgi:transposase-like protein